MYGKKRTFKNYSNDVKLIHSNVSKFFINHHPSMLYSFANGRNLDENSNRMEGEVFSKENRICGIYWEIVPLNQYRGTIKRVGQYKSRVLSQELQESF